MTKSDLSTLYICYFGLREPLVQTQVVPYLIELAKGGVDVSLLTFEPNDDDDRGYPTQMSDASEILIRHGINWIRLSYHKRPSLPATAYDILAGAIKGIKIIRNRKIDIVHARAHIPLAMALLIRMAAGCKLIFDVRGFLADEYVDSGIWKEGSVAYRMVKWLERKGLKSADRIVVLTRKAKEYLTDKCELDPSRIEVIPCCVGFSGPFDESWGTEKSRFGLIYCGSVTGLYLLSEMADFFVELKRARPNAHFTILTLGDASDIRRLLAAKGLSDADFLVTSTSPEGVSDHLRKASVGISFRLPTFAQIAASPTKIPEYLEAGIPVITNAGIGDTDEILSSSKTGVIVEGFGRDQLSDAVARVIALAEDDKITARCRMVAKSEFSLEKVGGPRYLRLYRGLSRREE
ncbi:MAG: glycosyltransferase family 4 protein [Aridibacter famidurans]|nr:glycosyltransferase family 4 protein [Aridibacter famidurans]